MSGEMGFGPLEENETTVGAMTSFHASLKKMVAVGLLKKKKLISRYIMNLFIPIMCNNHAHCKCYFVLLMYSKTLRPSSGLIQVDGNGQLKAKSGGGKLASDMMVPTPLAYSIPEPSEAPSQ